MMKIQKPQPGTYIVAVSGGVDSMVLLDMLCQQPDISLVVAHVDHGIRPDSHIDRQLVEEVTMSHNVLFESTRLELGPEASEEKARHERYNFLRHTQERYAADAIITAHHRDDVLETAILNMQRGTGWRGLSSLRSTSQMLRPLIDVTKQEIVEYARAHNVQWREDSTNTDMRYARNALRHIVMPRLTTAGKKQMHEIIVRQNGIAEQIDAELNTWLEKFATVTPHAIALPRYQLIMLPQHVAHEAFQAVLRRTSGKSLPRPLVDRAIIFCKVAKSGKIMPLSANTKIRIMRHEVIVEVSENVLS